MTLSGFTGSFTSVLFRRHISPEFRERLASWTRIFDEQNALADAAGLPQEYILCPHCGAQDWRMPPHGFQEGCPIVTETARSFGMKLDAERNLTARAGMQGENLNEMLEKMLRAQGMLPEEGDEDGET